MDNISVLPPWNDDFDKFDDEDGESWKPKPTRDACKAMYEQWRTVLLVLQAALDGMKMPDEDSFLESEMLKDQISMMMNDAYEVGIKIRSSEAGLYIIRMENAAIIRKNAQFIKISTNNFLMGVLMEHPHIQIIRDEIDKFRLLFIKWVATFEKDDVDDDWGLFV